MVVRNEIDVYIRERDDWQKHTNGSGESYLDGLIVKNGSVLHDRRLKSPKNI